MVQYQQYGTKEGILVQDRSAHQRNGALDAIKVAATTAILFHHHQQFSGAYFSNHINFWGSSAFHWWVMVELFFMISGFLAYTSLPAENRRFAPFIGKKLNRLVPSMACAVGVFSAAYFYHYFATGRIWKSKVLPSLWSTVVSALGLQQGYGFAGGNINFPTWFVSVLILCFCLEYWLVWACRRRNWRMEWALVLIVFLCQNMRWLEMELPFCNNWTLRGYQCFSIGLLLGSFVKHYRVNRPVAALCAAAMTFFVAAVCVAPGFMDPDMGFTYLFAPALIVLAQTQTAQRLFGHRVWGRLCEISYSTYLWHSPILLLLCTFVPQLGYSQHPSGLYIFAAICWAVGTALHFCLERPLRQWVPKVWGKIFVQQG